MCCMDLDEMLRQEMDELDYSPDAGIGLLSLIYRMCCNTEFYYVGKFPRMGIGFNFVGGTRDPPSALLVFFNCKPLPWSLCV